MYINVASLAKQSNAAFKNRLFLLDLLEACEVEYISPWKLLVLQMACRPLCAQSKKGILRHMVHLQ